MALSSIASAKSFLSRSILVLQRLQPTGVRHFQTAILGLPLVEGGTADPVLATQVRRPQPGLLLLQYRNDLFLYSVSSSQGTTFDAGSLLLFAVGTWPLA